MHAWFRCVYNNNQTPPFSCFSALFMTFYVSVCRPSGDPAWWSPPSCTGGESKCVCVVVVCVFVPVCPAYVFSLRYSGYFTSDRLHNKMLSSSSRAWHGIKQFEKLKCSQRTYSEMTTWPFYQPIMLLFIPLPQPSCQTAKGHIFSCCHAEVLCSQSVLSSFSTQNTFWLHLSLLSQSLCSSFV